MRYFILVCFCILFLQGATLSRDSQRGIVSDIKNQLDWADTKANVEIKLTHKEAEKYCEEYSQSGYRNWRLPHIDEFKLIVDKKNSKSYINRKFKFNLNKGYWAETAHIRTFWFYADYMNFISGTAYFDNRDTKKYVRCVRDKK